MQAVMSTLVAKHRNVISRLMCGCRLTFAAWLRRALTNSLIQYLAELDCFNCAIKTLARFLIAVLAIKLQRQRTPPRRLQARRAAASNSFRLASIESFVASSVLKSDWRLPARAGTSK